MFLLSHEAVPAPVPVTAHNPTRGSLIFCRICFQSSCVPLSLGASFFSAVHPRATPRPFTQRTKAATTVVTAAATYSLEALSEPCRLLRGPLPPQTAACGSSCRRHCFSQGTKCCLPAPRTVPHSMFLLWGLQAVGDAHRSKRSFTQSPKSAGLPIPSPPPRRRRLVPFPLSLDTKLRRCMPGTLL